MSIIAISTKDNKITIMEQLNKIGKQYYEKVDNTARQMCKTKNELKVLNDWLSGISIHSDNYDKTSVSEEEFYNAESIILWVVGQGCG